MRNILLTLGFLLSIVVSAQNADSKQAIEAVSRATVNSFFQSFGEKDPNKIASFIAEDVDWYIYESKYFPWTGKRSRRSEIPEVFKTLFSFFVNGKEQFKMDAMLVDGNNVAVFAELGRQFKSSGKAFTMKVAIYFKVESGLISKFYLYEQTKILEKAYKQ